MAKVISRQLICLLKVLISEMRMHRRVSQRLFIAVWVAVLAAASATAQTVKQANPTNWQTNWEGTWASLVSLGEEAKNYSNNMAACCMGPGTDIPLTPKYRAMRDAYVNRDREQAVVNNTASCIPLGLPGVLTHPILFEILINSNRVTMIFEDGEARRIWTDGRKHPGSEELVESDLGDSVGKWQNGVLTVETVDISPRAEVFMANGITVTRQTKISEKMYLKDKDTLVIEMTVTDPEIFTTPYVRKFGYTKLPGTFVVGCGYNNRDNGAGEVDLSLPPG